MTLNSTGIVIIGRNEGARLVACLASIAATGSSLVYVDSGSTDGSQVFAREAGAFVVALDPARPFTAARARREGADALGMLFPTLEFVQFVDGDCVVASEWLSTAQAFLERSPRHAVVCGRRREQRPQASVYNRMADIEWDTPIGDAAACGGDAMIRLSAYQAVGGFDASLIAGEEPELCARLASAGWLVRRLEADMTVHDMAMDRLSQWWARAVRSGFGYAQAYLATRGTPDPLYRREIARAVGWTTLPLAVGIAAAAIGHPLLILAAPVVYIGQVVRLALRSGASNRFHWARAGLLTLGKVAETWGMLRFVFRVVKRAPGGTIVYK